MKLTVTLIDKREKASPYGIGTPTRVFEDYTRFGVDEMSANRRVIAGVLRALADDLDPIEVAS